MDGRLKLIEEVDLAETDVKQYLADISAQLLQDRQFSACLPGHLQYGSATIDRANMLLDRIKCLAAMGKKQ